MSKTVLRHSKVLDEIHEIREKISKELEGKSSEDVAKFWTEGAKIISSIERDPKTK